MKSYRLNNSIKEQVCNHIVATFNKGEDSQEETIKRARSYLQSILGAVLLKHISGSELHTLAKFGHMSSDGRIKICVGKSDGTEIYGISGMFDNNFPLDKPVRIISGINIYGLTIPSCINDISSPCKFTGDKPIVQQMYELCYPETLKQHFDAICLANAETAKFKKQVIASVNNCNTSKQLIELFPALESKLVYFGPKQNRTLSKEIDPINVSNINTILAD